MIKQMNKQMIKQVKWEEMIKREIQRRQRLALHATTYNLQPKHGKKQEKIEKIN